MLHQNTNSGPTAEHLRRTARIAFDPKAAFLEHDKDGQLRICHVPRLVDPRLPELWQPPAERR